jgi:putative Mn2+ efflux pump MntP
MPLAGWLLGDAAGTVIRAWDHWVTFARASAPR